MILYNNQSCSKCNRVAHILAEENIRFSYRNYMESPLDRAELIKLLGYLDITASQLLRTSEPVYQQRYAGQYIDEEQALDLMVAEPVLMQRPIVVESGRAMICRPAEKIYDFLNSL